LKIQEEKNSDAIIDRIEHVSSEIQLLALNIAVAAAKITHKEAMSPEVNERLSQLVNQATRTVRQMNQILTAAGSKSDANRITSDVEARIVDRNLIDCIESTMEAIISDSDKITHILAGLKKR
jgi:hypothetical protein